MIDILGEREIDQRLLKSEKIQKMSLIWDFWDTASVVAYCRMDPSQNVAY